MLGRYTIVTRLPPLVAMGSLALDFDGDSLLDHVSISPSTKKLIERLNLNRFGIPITSSQIKCNITDSSNNRYIYILESFFPFLYSSKTHSANAVVVEQNLKDFFRSLNLPSKYSINTIIKP
ncbi:hypothetical protein [Proteus mirabilis]|uniref:hypothetical protein n=1 Tax=Proteus mirabilis TaxID=584 RepID=UPI0034D7950C